MGWSDTPTLLLCATVCTYWFCVGKMIRRVRRNAGGVRRAFVPARPLERAMWLLWAPLVLAWMILPILSMTGAGRESLWLRPPPAIASSVAAGCLRMLAAAVAVVCLLLSIWCWRHMGRHWRMGIDPSQKSPLLVDGPFAKVRHPIYGLSILLMLSSVVILPAPAVLIVAAIHIGLLLLKTRNEERFLLERHGQAYADYCARTRRYLPSLKHGYKASSNGKTSHPPRRPPGRHEGPLPPAGWKLNQMQQSMLMWEEIHPYNAAHVVRLSGPSDPARLRDAIERTVRAAGIGELAVNPETQTFHYLPLQHLQLETLPPADRAEEVLACLLNRQMNAPFPEEPCHPIRWFAFDEAAGDGHYVGLAYRHLASDARGIECLLSCVLQSYVGGSTVEPARIPRPDPSIAESAAQRPRRPGAGLKQIAQGLAAYFRFRHVHKMPDEAALGDETALVQQSLPEGVFGRLSAACRDRGAGINDAFLAALASALAARTPHRRKRRRRHGIALGTIASTRNLIPADVSRYFGICLSDVVVMLDQPDIPASDLLAQVAEQMRHTKADLRPDSGISGLQRFFVRSIWPILDIPHHRRSYRKLLPICAGVSTFVVNAGRFGSAAPRIGRYLRACPPGPALPLVLAPTIFAGQVELTLVYRTSCLRAAEAEDLLRGICDCLQKLLPGDAAPVGRPCEARPPTRQPLASGNLKKGR